MTDRADWKMQEVAVAEFRHRHEAEFAAGFLSDAGIPFRLQIDDAGGAALGVTIARPALLWVRAMDLDLARELLALEDGAADAPQPVVRRPRARVDDPPLTGVQRGVAGALAVALVAASFAVPPGPSSALWVGLLGVLAVLLGASVVVGRAPGPIKAALRALSGDAP